MYADPNVTTFLGGLTAHRAWITYVCELYDNIYSSPPYACIGARMRAFFHPRCAQSRSDTSRYVSTYLPTYRGTWSAAFSSGHGKGFEPTKTKGSRESEEDEKKASDVRGRISGIREIITVYIECNLAKRMQRCIEACLQAQGRAKKCALLIMPVIRQLRLKRAHLGIILNFILN